METLSALLAGEQYHGHLRESHDVIAVSVVIVIAVLSEYQTQNYGGPLLLLIHTLCPKKYAYGLCFTRFVAWFSSTTWWIPITKG